MRIVSLAPSNTEILFALGVGNQVVGVTAFCDYPKEVKQLPKVGGWTSANSEKIAALKPDLVITSTFLQKEAPMRFKGYPFEVLHVDPKDLDSVFASILEIGVAVNRKREAQLLIHRLKRQMLLQLPSTSLPMSHNLYLDRKPRVYTEEWSTPPMVSGNWVPELVKLAGGHYLPISSGNPSREITNKEIQAFNPQIILLSLCGFGNRTRKEVITKRPGWQDLAAVKSGRVYVVDDSLLNRPGPRLVKGLHLLNSLVKHYISGA